MRRPFAYLYDQNRVGFDLSLRTQHATLMQRLRAMTNAQRSKWVRESSYRRCAQDAERSHASHETCWKYRDHLEPPGGWPENARHVPGEAWT